MQAKEWVLCGSEVLEYEISRIPDAARRAESLSVLSLATEFLQINQAAESLAIAFEHQGLSAIDALHLATASEAKLDFFCSCDDKLLRKASVITGLGCRVISLLNLVVEISS